MARQRLNNYVFTPGVSGAGTIKVPGRYNLEDFLAIYNTTDQISIYNFGDTAQGGTVAFTATLGSVIGKALEDFNGESGTIEVVVGRL